jgi:CheY-like chemotaxis protein
VLLLKRAFRSSAVAVPLVVGDGRDAIEYLSGSGAYTDRRVHPLPSVMVLDLELPRVSGFEVSCGCETSRRFGGSLSLC